MAIPCYGEDHSKNHGFYYYYQKKNPNCLTVLKWTGWIIRPTSTSRFKDKFNYNHDAMMLWLILALYLRRLMTDSTGFQEKTVWVEKWRLRKSRVTPGKIHVTSQVKAPNWKQPLLFLSAWPTLVCVRRLADATFWAEPPEGTLWVQDGLIATIRALTSISYQHL